MVISFVVRALTRVALLPMELNSGTASSTSFAVKNNFAHLLHLRLETTDLKQDNGLCGLVHLIDGIVHGGNEILDICPIERRDKGRPNRYENFACNVICLGLSLENLLAIILDRVATLQQPAQRFGTGDDDSRVFLKERKETLLLGHERLKPTKHSGSRFAGGESQL
jgi:hypothetical protein